MLTCRAEAEACRTIFITVCTSNHDDIMLPCDMTDLVLGNGTAICYAGWPRMYCCCCSALPDLCEKGNGLLGR